ncbi:MAG: hypothetical protein GF311_07115 [Candidatus Lokiarchaeota archaeon]|nr:hypothetical protein [Candidatus Lokiarchaeota archaeon]
MKYLLKQRLDFKKEKTLYYLYPNSFSRKFVKIAKKEGLIFDVNYRWVNKHRIVRDYEILENDFKKVFKIFRIQIEDKRKKFYRRPYLEQLLLVLRYLFKRNKRAKRVNRYSATQKAYEDKSRFLGIALDIAKKIKHEHFSFGWQEDPGTINFEYVYYFQFREKQISFHSPQLYPNVPEFEGQWIGNINETFPFDLRSIKKYL